MYLSKDSVTLDVSHPVFTLIIFFFFNVVPKWASKLKRSQANTHWNHYTALSTNATAASADCCWSPIPSFSSACYLPSPVVVVDVVVSVTQCGCFVAFYFFTPSKRARELRDVSSFSSTSSYANEYHNHKHIP